MKQPLPVYSNEELLAYNSIMRCINNHRQFVRFFGGL